ncbi:MAG: MFS transporter, partial [Acidimicrobiales bacterium]
DGEDGDLKSATPLFDARVNRQYGHHRILRETGSIQLVRASARGTAWLFAARAVQGLGTGAVTGAATAALVELEPNQNRQRASYINTIVFVMGAASGPLLFGCLVQYLPWPLVLPFLIQIGMVVVGLAGVKMLPETVAREPVYRWRIQRPSVPRPVLGPFVVAALALAVTWGVGRERSHAVAGLVLFVFYGLGGVSQISLRHWPARRAMAVGVTSVSAGMILVYWGLADTNLVMFMAGTLLAGAGGGLGFMGSLVLVNEVAPPTRRAEVVSAWNVVGYVALSAPVIGVGLLAGLTGLRKATGIFTVAVITMSLMTVVAVALSPRRPLAGLSQEELIELGLDPAVIASGTG